MYEIWAQFKTPKLLAIRVTKEVHSTGPTIRKFPSHWRTISCTAGNFYFVHHGIKNAKFINTNGSNIPPGKTHKGKPFIHQTQGRMLDIIATGLRIRV